MNAMPELRPSTPPARAAVSPAGDGRRDAFEQALARRSPPRPGAEPVGRSAGGASRAGAQGELEDASAGSSEPAVAGQAGDAVTGLQTMPDPLASLTPAARMALSAGSPTPSVSALGPAGTVAPDAVAIDAVDLTAFAALEADQILGDPAQSTRATGSDPRSGASRGHAASLDGESALSGREAGSPRAHAVQSAEVKSDGSAVAEAGAVPGRPLEPLTGQSTPAPAASGMTSAVDAAALVARLIGQVPLSGSADDAIRMLFPAGSGPIEQIVLNREAGQLNLVVSATPSAREAVSRSVLELERRLRDRGLPVGAVRVSERESGR